VHVRAHLLDGVGNVRPREGKILEHTSEAPVGCRIGDRWSVVLRELRLSVDKRGAGLAVVQASPLQDVESVLALVEEETMRSSLGGDAKEVMKRPYVLHRELPLKGSYRVLKKVGSGHREHDVIDVEQEEDGVVVAPIDEQGCVRLDLNEVEEDQVGS
jgi:hypothetical protein